MLVVLARQRGMCQDGQPDRASVLDGAALLT